MKRNAADVRSQEECLQNVPFRAKKYSRRVEDRLIMSNVSRNPRQGQKSSLEVANVASLATFRREDYKQLEAWIKERMQAHLDSVYGMFVLL